MPLNLPGITTIRGQNRDTANPKDQSNGVGKTLLCAALPNLLYFEPPGSIRRNSAKDVLGDRGRVTLNYSNSEHSYQISQYRQGGVKYEISRDNNPSKIRRVEHAKETIQQIFPLTQDQFYSTVYLNALTGANRLLSGSGSERMGLFENLFPLEVFETMQVEIKKRLEASKQAAITLQALKEELATLQSHNLTHLTSRYEILSRKVEKRQSKLDEISRRLYKLEAASQLLARAAEIPSKPIKDLLADYAELRTAYQATQKELERAVAINESWSIFQTRQEKVQALKQQLADLPETEEIDLSGLDKLKEELARNLRLLRAYKEALPEIQKWQQSKPELQKRFSSLFPKEDMKDHVTLAKELVREASKVELHLAFHAKGKVVCDTCGTRLDPEQQRQALTNLRRRKRELQEQLDLLREIATYGDISGRLRGEFQDFDYEETKQHTQALKERFEQCRAAEQTAARRREIKAALGSLELTKPKEERLKLEPLRKDLQSLRQEAENLKAAIELLRNLKELGFELAQVKTASQDLAQEREREAKISGVLGRLRQRFSQAQADYLLARKQQERRQELESRIEELGKLAKKLRILTILSDAYGPRGLVVHAIQGLASRYVNNMNRLAGEMYNEPYEFSFTAKGRDLQILVKRNNGLISDVRHLSGYEGRVFALASVVSLIPLMPASHRTNFLCLDEMDSNLSRENRRRLATELLPKIAERIPSLYLITPLDRRDFLVPNSRELLVIKEKGQSHLEGL